MQAFLDKTAEYIIDTWGDELGKLCIVLPNRRAGLFLKRYLGKHASKTIWSPSIFSIEDFITTLSGLKVIDPVYLQFELYKVYREIEGQNAKEYGEFLKWGRILLNDFNEIDKYLLDSQKLFEFLNDVQAIALWNPDNRALTPFELNYLRFYNSLKVYYDRLTKILLDKRQVYLGLAYRKVADDIENHTSKMPWKKIIFVGFNALTAAEKKIIFTLEKLNIAALIWDADRYYIDDEIQEAGRFIRNYSAKTDQKNFSWMDDNFSEGEQEINVIGVPQNVLQAKAAGQILSEVSVIDQAMKHTAVVMNDESLLEPLLNSMPEKIGSFNLTMGLSLRNTPLFQLINSIFNLQINILKFDYGGARSSKIYFRDLLKVIEHPYFRITSEHEDISVLTDKIRTSNKVFFSFSDLKRDIIIQESESAGLLEDVFKSWMNNPEIAITCILRLINDLKNKFSVKNSDPNTVNNSPSLELEYLFYFSGVFQRLRSLLKEYPYIENIQTLKDLFLQLSGSVNIPFYGEPLKGLQIMGMLETQALDFENLVMLSVNEDFIPSGKSGSSFIPFEIRCRFSLPTYKERNAVFAYHFYRLLQRTKKAYLLYNTEPGDLGGGEKSRFITQLIYELPKYNKKIRIKESILSVTLVNDKINDTITISKNQSIQRKLNELAVIGLSASAINTWRNCSLQFYFKYVVGLEETEDIEETIEAGTLGTVVHEVLEAFYGPLKNKFLKRDDIERMKPYVDTYTRDAFRKNYKDGDIDFGKNLLVVKVVCEFINNFLEKESGFLTKTGQQPIILEIEESFETTANIKVGDVKTQINLRGFIDRIDKTNDKIRIIDYKTGKVEQRDLKINAWEDLASESKLSKCFQLLFYSYLYHRSRKTNLNLIEPGIISFRNLSHGFLKIVLPDDEEFSEITIIKFESILQSILRDIFDPVIPFVQTVEKENCRYCSFLSVCNRN
jgi:hypothetical protein